MPASVLTVTKDAVELVFREECEPVDSLLLVFPELSVDLDRNLVLLHFGSVQQLRKELPLLVPATEKVFRKVRRVRKSSLRRTVRIVKYVIKIVSLTSRGTILTKEANVFVAVDRMSSSESLMRPSTGTIMKITYGRALMSSFCTMSTPQISTEK